MDNYGLIYKDSVPYWNGHDGLQRLSDLPKGHLRNIISKYDRKGINPPRDIHLALEDYNTCIPLPHEALWIALKIMSPTTNIIYEPDMRGDADRGWTLRGYVEAPEIFKMEIFRVSGFERKTHRIPRGKFLVDFGCRYFVDRVGEYQSTVLDSSADVIEYLQGPLHKLEGGLTALADHILTTQEGV